MVAMATALIIMEAIGESLMVGVIHTTAGVGAILTMDGAPLIMVMDMGMGMVMDTAPVMGMLIIEVEETAPMQEEQLIEEIIDILVLEGEQDTLTAEDLILLAEVALIPEANLAGDLVTVEEIQTLNDQDPHPIVEVTPAEGHLIPLQDRVLAQDLILTEALAEALVVVAEATEAVAEVVLAAAAVAEDAAEFKT